jgi:hypothetical protein
VVALLHVVALGADDDVGGVMLSGTTEADFGVTAA